MPRIGEKNGTKRRQILNSRPFDIIIVRKSKVKERNDIATLKNTVKMRCSDDEKYEKSHGASTQRPETEIKINVKQLFIFFLFTVFFRVFPVVTTKVGNCELDKS